MKRLGLCRVFLEKNIPIAIFQFTLCPLPGGTIIVDSNINIVSDHNFPSLPWVRWFMRQEWVGGGLGLWTLMFAPCDRRHVILSKCQVLHSQNRDSDAPPSPRRVGEVVDAEHWASFWAQHPCWYCFSYSGFVCKSQAHYFTFIWGSRGLENVRTWKGLFSPGKPSALQMWKL